jgi:hypothetical protein
VSVWEVKVLIYELDNGRRVFYAEFQDGTETIAHTNLELATQVQEWWEANRK